MKTGILVALAFASFTALNVYGYYDPSVGRWTSRDPGDEDGDNNLNLYEFAGNDANDYYDILGLRWLIMRNGDEKAVAVPQAGDTISGLADTIGLNANQYPMWLTVGPTTFYPASANQIMSGCESFEVPNTVVAYWAGFGAGVGKTFVSWKPSVRYLRSLGFKVDSFNHQTGDAYALQEILKTESEAKRLHGLYVWAHGFEPYPSPGLDSQSHDPLLYYVDVEDNGTIHHRVPLFYGMALGLVFACDSNSGKDALMSGDANQIWNGYTETLNPFKPGLKFSVDNFIKHGQQGTK